MEPAKRKDRWDKVAIVLQPVGGLLTAAAIAVFGFVTSNKLDERQAVETNTRLYSELMSRREESESALRKDMFVSIISSFLNQGGSDLNSDVLNLELLAYNFHESLNLKPLFFDLRRRIADEAAHSGGKSDSGVALDYVQRLESVAREIARKQMIVLESVGENVDRTVDLTVDPAGTSLEPARLVLDSLNTTLAIDVLGADRDKREIQLALSVETPDARLGRQTKIATFAVSYYDFPMIDNVRLSQDRRCAVVLNHFSDQSADLTIVLFPGTYAGLKEKPYYNEVIENVLSESKKMQQ